MSTAGKGVVTSTGKRGVGSGGKAVVFDGGGECSDCCVVCKDTLTLTASNINASACAGCYTGFATFKYENVVIDIDGDWSINGAGDGTYSRGSIGQVNYDRGNACGFGTPTQKTLGIGVSIVCPTPSDPNPTDLGKILVVTIGTAVSDDVSVFRYISGGGPDLFVGDTIPNQIDNCQAVGVSVATSLSDGTGSVVIQ